MDATQKHFVSFINKFKLFAQTEKLCISFSAGVDSVVLLDLLFQTGFKNIELIHFNHQNRKCNIDDEKLCNKLAKKYKIKCKIIKLFGLDKSNFEHLARKKRYAYLKAIPNKVLLGHHINDSFEWHLMQKFKSSGAPLTAGIPLVNQNCIRPLMCLSKKQIRKYAKSWKLEFLEDPTNSSLDYERNKIRHELIPWIEKNYSNYLCHYVRQARFLSMRDGTYLLAQKKWMLKKYSSRIELVSFDFEGADDELDFLIREAISLIDVSKSKRSSQQGQIDKIKSLVQNRSSASLKMHAGINCYIESNLIIISKSTLQERRPIYKKTMSLDEYQQILSSISLGGVFVKVDGLRLPLCKKNRSYTDYNIGKVSPFNLLRHWSKTQNRQKLLKLNF